MAAKKYRVVAPYIKLRKSPDEKSPLYEQEHFWAQGAVFTPPAHMNVEKALSRGIIEPVSGKEANGE